MGGLAMEFQEFVRRADKGQILIGIEPANARKFYTDRDPKRVYEVTGYDSRAEAFMIRTVWILEFVSLLMGIVLSVMALCWWSLGAIPLMLLLFLFLGDRASVGPVRLRGAVVLQTTCSLASFSLRVYGWSLVLWFMLLPTPFLFAKCTYWLAVNCLRNASTKSAGLYQAILGTILFIKEDLDTLTQ